MLIVYKWQLITKSTSIEVPETVLDEVVEGAGLLLAEVLDVFTQLVRVRIVEPNLLHLTMFVTSLIDIFPVLAGLFSFE